MVMTLTLLAKLVESEVENLHLRVDQMGDLARQQTERLDSIDRRIDLLFLEHSELHQRMERLEVRVANLERRISTLEERVSVLEDRLSAVEARLMTIEGRLGAVESGLARVDDSLVKLEGGVQAVLALLKKAFPA